MKKLLNASLAIFSTVLALVFVAELVAFSIVFIKGKDRIDVSEYLSFVPEQNYENTSKELFDLGIALYCAGVSNESNYALNEFFRSESAEVFVINTISDLMRQDEIARAIMIAEMISTRIDLEEIVYNVCGRTNVSIDSKAKFVSGVKAYLQNEALLKIGSRLHDNGIYGGAYVVYLVADTKESRDLLDLYEWKVSRKSSSAGNQIEEYTYDSRGRVVVYSSNKYGVAYTTSYAYDGSSRLIGTKRVDKYDYLNQSERYYYLNDGRLDYVQTDSYEDGEHYYVTTYHYNSAGLLVQTKKMDLKTSGVVVIENYEYNTEGFLVSYSETDMLSNYTTRLEYYTYDNQGRLLTLNNRKKKLVSTYTYGDDGRIVSRKDNTSTYVYNYDVAGNLVSESLEGNAYTKYEYVCLLKSTDK